MPRIFPVFALLIAAIVLRYHDPSGRVMHTDEAVHAVTTGRLLAGEPFVYVPSDFHGPTLHYSTIPVALARGQTNFQKLDEATLRGVAAGYGVLLVLLAFAFRKDLGAPATWFAAWLITISPMMVFFSRYYIMELPFAVFLCLLGLCCWRFTIDPPSKRWPWAIGAGFALGLLHATKETFVIHVAAMAVAAVFAGGAGGPRKLAGFSRANWKYLATAAGIGFFVSAALLSHGFQRPVAILDGMRTYLLYLHRAEGSDAGHAQPWHYYFSALFSLRPTGGFWYSEIGLLLLAVAGMVRAFWFPPAEPRQKSFLRVLAIYTLTCIAAYSAIPYKTPWSFLAPTHGLILLAAAALAWFLPARPLRPLPKPALARVCAGAVLLAVVTTHALLYDREMILIAPAAPAQPMVYGHTSQGFLDLVKEIDRLESVEDRRLTVTVVEEENGWPMPWYRRQALGYNRYGHSMPDLSSPPDILVVSKEFLPDAAQALLASHQSRRFALRPGVEVSVFFRRTLAGLAAPAKPELRPRTPASAP